jgi:hypothetical protein
MVGIITGTAGVSPADFLRASRAQTCLGLSYGRGARATRDRRGRDARRPSLFSSQEAAKICFLTDVTWKYRLKVWRSKVFLC